MEVNKQPQSFNLIINIQALAEYGLTKCMLVDRIYTWCSYNQASGVNCIDGEYYMYHSYKGWEHMLHGVVKSNAIIKNLAWLQENGFIKILTREHEKYGKINYYTVTDKAMDIINPKLPPLAKKQLVNTNAHKEDEKPLKAIKKPKNNTSLEANGFNELIDEAINLESDEDKKKLTDALEAFRLHRCDINKKLTKTGAKRVINTIKTALETMSLDVILQSIDSTIMNSWTGLYFNKNTRPLTPPPGGVGGWDIGLYFNKDGTVQCSDGKRRAPMSKAGVKRTNEGYNYNFESVTIKIDGEDK